MSAVIGLAILGGSMGVTLYGLLVFHVYFRPRILEFFRRHTWFGRGYCQILAWDAEPQVWMVMITGSRCYGRPRKNSDLDMVLYCNKEFLNLMRGLFGRSPGAYGVNNATDFKIGKLHIICETDFEKFKGWRIGTRYLLKAKQAWLAARDGLAHRPLLDGRVPFSPTRDEAVTVFKTIRSAMDAKDDLGLLVYEAGDGQAEEVFRNETEKVDCPPG